MKKFRFIPFFVLLLLLSHLRVYALASIEFDTNEVLLIGDMLDLKTVHESEPYYQIKNNDQGWFQSDKAYYYKSVDDSVIWGKFIVTNMQYKQVVVEFMDHRIDELILYDSKGEMYKTGDHHPFDTRELQHKNFSFVLPLQQGEKGLFYFQVKSHQRIGLYCKLRTVDRFVEYSLNEYLLLGIFYGILLVISCLNLISFLKLKQLSYLYYSLYVLSLGMFSACQDGFAFQFLWGGFSNWNEAFALMLCCYMVFELLYVSEFLELKTRANKLYYVFRAIMLFRFVYFLVGWVFAPQILHNFLLDELHLFVVFAAACWMLWKKKYKPAKLFILGFSFLMLGYAIYELAVVELLPNNIFTVYSLQIGMCVEFVVLVYAFAEKLRYERDLKEKAQNDVIESLGKVNKIQQSVNESLEKKVDERTAKIVEQNQLLSEKNDALENMQKKLWKMNEDMDRLNWQLSKDVETHVNKRVKGEVVSFENFINIYPTEKSILKLLHELKSTSGFSCQKCTNEKCKVNDIQYIRICSQCGHRESASAATLLHGMRIDKQIALYLVYRYITDPEVDVKQLAEKFNMRITTLYSLRKKVFEVTNKVVVKDWTKMLCHITH